MLSPLSLALGSVLLLLSGTCSLGTGQRNDAQSEDEKLQQVQDDFFDWRKRENPYISTKRGDTNYNHLLKNFSTGAIKREAFEVLPFLSRVHTINRAQLSNRQHQYNRDVLFDMLNTFVTQLSFQGYGPLNPINMMESNWDLLTPMVRKITFHSVKDFEDYIRRLEAWPAQIAQIKARMNRAISLNTTNHIVSMGEVPQQISTMTARNPLETRLYKSFRNEFNTIVKNRTERERLRSRAVTALQNAWRTLADLTTFIENTYMPNTRATHGVHGVPGGEDYYRACLKWHLTVDMSPEEVHSKGLQEVDRISQLMQEIMSRQKFTGTVVDFYNKLIADPNLSFKSWGQLSQHYNDAINNMTTLFGSYFKNSIPNIQVRLMSFDGPLGFYRPVREDSVSPATFYFNPFSPGKTKTFRVMPLVLHETVPGKHVSHQFLSGLPAFRKYGDNFTFSVPCAFPTYEAYSEGWALYAEYLGEEMELYPGDFDKMGRYESEMIQACRLLIDTKIHHKSWTRDKAVRYLREKLPMSAAEAGTEVDYIITWPGRACGPKIAELKIRELRERAEQALGERFDLREFHSVLLDNGPVPLRLMEAGVNDYIHRVIG